MPKYKVKINIPQYEKFVEAIDSNTAENMVEEEFFFYLENNVNILQTQEVK